MQRTTQLLELPNNWIISTLDEVGIIVSGGTPSTNQPQFWNGNISWITPADLSKHTSKYIAHGNRSITQDWVDNSSATLIPKGSILFSSRAPIWYVAIAENEMTTSQGFKNIIPLESTCSDYIYYYLKTIKPLAEKMASWTTFLELSGEKFKKIPIPLPPLNEQARIVAKIEELFSEIDYSLENLKKAGKWLEKYRHTLLDRAFYGKSLKGKTIFIKDIGDISTGTTPPKNNFSLYWKEFNFYKPSDLSSNSYIIDSIDKLSGEWFKLARTVPSGSILVTCIGSIGKVGLVWKEGAFNQQINAIIPNEKYLAKFIYYQIISPTFQNQLKEVSVATTIAIINKSKFERLKFISFPIGKQLEIIEELDHQLTLIDNLEKSINTSIIQTETFRQSILKKAFNGQLVEQNLEDEPISELLNQLSLEKKEYLAKQKQFNSTKPKKVKMDNKLLSVKDILQSLKDPILTEELWKRSIFKDDIEWFYAELKQIWSEIKEIRKKSDSFLTLQKWE